MKKKDNSTKCECLVIFSHGAQFEASPSCLSQVRADVMSQICEFLFGVERYRICSIAQHDSRSLGSNVSNEQMSFHATMTQHNVLYADQLRMGLV